VEVPPGVPAAFPAAFSGREVDSAGLYWRLETREGALVSSGQHPPVQLPGGHVPLEDVVVEVPEERGIYVLQAWLETSQSEVVARAGSYLVSDGPAGNEPHALSGETLVTAEGVFSTSGGHWCEGACELVFQVPVPGEPVGSATLVAELASFDPREPQSDPVAHAAAVEVLVDGTVAAQTTLEDAPADHRGVLSILRDPELRGAYGYLLQLDLGPLELTDVAEVRLRALDHGVRVFTRHGGRYLETPRLVLVP